MEEYYWYAHCKNVQTGETFRKPFFSPYLLEKFLKRCKYSKKIVVLYHNHPDYVY